MTNIFLPIVLQIKLMNLMYIIQYAFLPFLSLRFSCTRFYDVRNRHCFPYAKLTHHIRLACEHSLCILYLHTLVLRIKGRKGCNGILMDTHKKLILKKKKSSQNCLIEFYSCELFYSKRIKL